MPVLPSFVSFLSMGRIPNRRRSRQPSIEREDGDLETERVRRRTTPRVHTEKPGSKKRTASPAGHPQCVSHPAHPPHPFCPLPCVSPIFRTSIRPHFVPTSLSCNSSVRCTVQGPAWGTDKGRGNVLQRPCSSGPSTCCLIFFEQNTSTIGIFGLST